jgi:hypothetical protein
VGVRGIEGQVAPAGLEDRQGRDHRLGRPRRDQRDRPIGGDPGGDQALGQLVGGRVELAVGERAAVPQERDLIGRAGCDLAKHAVDGGVGAEVATGGVPGLDDLRAAGRGQGAERAHVVGAGPAREHRAPQPGEELDGGGVELRRRVIGDQRVVDQRPGER